MTAAMSAKACAWRARCAACFSALVSAIFVPPLRDWLLTGNAKMPQKKQAVNLILKLTKNSLVTNQVT
jgi:hypothetical protein